jgi:IS5 family transposase
MEKPSFDAFNEGITLIDSVARYKERFSSYPEVVYADKIYRNRENLKFCKGLGIRLSGPALGRPSTDPKVLKEQRRQEREDTKIRNGVEGKFGEAKRFYGLARIMIRLAGNCETVIAIQLLVMTLEHKLRILLALFSKMQFRNYIWGYCA